MRIVQINTSDLNGGAARAAYRLHKGLVQAGERAQTVVLNKSSFDDDLCRVTSRESEKQVARKYVLGFIQNRYINRNRTELTNTIFTLPYPGYDLSEMHIVRDSDIINLHWIAYFQSLVTLNKLFLLGKPVVWTLHDQWAFTGGCHYSAGCDKYKKLCSQCPQLSQDPYDLAEAVLKDKLELFSGANLTIVTPSRWLAQCAKESKIFKNLRVEAIPNSLETDLFIPLPKRVTKAGLGIPPDCVTLLFGAENGNEKRKGFLELLRAIQFCSEYPEFQNLVKRNKLRILCFGNPSDKLYSLGIPVISLGYINSDKKIRDTYSAADIFVLPSLEDNLPNTMLESMSCETPVVAFNIGGMPDMIVDGMTGRIVPLGNTRKMGEAILDLILNVGQRELMGKNCRRVIEKEYSLEVQAQRYLELYQELIKSNKLSSQVALKDTTVAPDSKEVLDAIAVNLETAVGPNFQHIYEQFLPKAINALKEERDMLRAERKSISWQVTAPLRLMERIFKKEKK